MHPTWANAEFVCQMEDVLDVFTGRTIPSGHRCAWTRPAANSWGMSPRPAGGPRSAGPRRLRIRARGVVNLFLVSEPLRGWRHVTVSNQRTRLDFARAHPGAGRFPLPRMPTASSWSWTTSTSTARLPCTRRSRQPRPSGWPTNCRSTTPPSTGSWLNLAEIELSALSGQCLDQRLADRATVERHVAAWQVRLKQRGHHPN